MNGIDGVGSANGAGPPSRRRTAPVSDGPHGFALPDQAETSGPGGALATAAPVALTGMLALQEAGVAETHERAARRHGLLVLQSLAGLQAALLGDGGLATAAQRLESLLAAMPQDAPRALQQVLQSVALRARIELARLGSPERGGPERGGPERGHPPA